MKKNVILIGLAFFLFLGLSSRIFAQNGDKYWEAAVTAFAAGAEKNAESISVEIKAYDLRGNQLESEYFTLNMDGEPVAEEFPAEDKPGGGPRGSGGGGAPSGGREGSPEPGSGMPPGGGGSQGGPPPGGGDGPDMSSSPRDARNGRSEEEEPSDRMPGFPTDGRVLFSLFKLSNPFDPDIRGVVSVDGGNGEYQFSIDLYQTRINGTATVQSGTGTPLEYHATIESNNDDRDGCSVKTEFKTIDGMAYPTRIVIKKKITVSAFDKRNIVCTMTPVY